MRPDFDNPSFWKSLYKRPADSNTQGVVAGTTELEDGDLEAELDPYAVNVEDAGSVDQEAVLEIVEAAVAKRIKELLDSGWGPNSQPASAAPRPAPPPHAAPRTPPPRPAPAP